MSVARLTRRVRLSGAQSSKQVYHLELSFPKEELYHPGDTLAIYPENSPVDVASLMARIQDTDSELEENLRKNYCIQHPTKDFVAALRNRLSEENLQYFDHLGEQIYTASIPQILRRFSAKFSKEEILPLLKKMRPRLYSIASSSLQFPQEIHLIVARATHQDCFGEESYGVASRWICETAAINSAIHVAIIASKFKLPDDDARDVIMIGPGTGVAPFRSFLQEREAKQKAGIKIGRQWLFFGDQHRNEHFYYRSEMEQWLRDGVLTHLDLAFSRDQEYKIYVQDRMKEHAVELWKWINNGAYIYVCGDAAHMAVDVESTLLAIVRNCGNVSHAEEFLKILKKERRYQRDVY